MKQKRIETRSLIISAIVNIIMSFAGFWVYKTTGINALFLDFSFSCIAALSIITAILISHYSRKTTQYYPNGLYFLEPLYAIFKSLLTLTLLIVTVLATSYSAYKYFVYGIGDVMNIGPIFPYAILMVILCFGLALFNKYQNKRINNISTILNAESKSNMIDGILSLGVGLAVLPLSIISLDSHLGFLHYTGDFFITLILVLISLKEPIRVLKEAFHELSGGLLLENDLNKMIEDLLKENLLEEYCQYSIYKMGMKLTVEMKFNDTIQDLHFINEAKRKIKLKLLENYDHIEVKICI